MSSSLTCALIVLPYGFTSFCQLILLTSMFVASITNNGDDAQLAERDGDYYLSLDGSGTDTSLVSLEYIDNENDTVTVASTKELLDAMELFHDEQTLRLSVRFKVANNAPRFKVANTAPQAVRPSTNPAQQTAQRMRGAPANPGISAMRGGTVRANSGITAAGASVPMESTSNVGVSPTMNAAGSVEAVPTDGSTADGSDSTPKETVNPPDLMAPPASESPPNEAGKASETSDAVSNEPGVSFEEGDGASASEEDTTVSKQEETPSVKVINSVFNALGTGLEAVEKGLDLIPKNKKGKPDWQAKRKALQESKAAVNKDSNDANDSPVTETEVEANTLSSLTEDTDTDDEAAAESPPTAEVKSDKETKWDITKPDSLPHFAQVSSGDKRISPPVSSPPEAAFTISENKSVPPPAFGLSEMGKYKQRKGEDFNLLGL